MWRRGDTKKREIRETRKKTKKLKRKKCTSEWEKENVVG